MSDRVSRMCPMLSTVPSNNALRTTGALSMTHAEAAARLEVEGYNELPQTGDRRLLHLAFELLREPMVYLLLGCGAVYWCSAIGKKRPCCWVLSA